MNTYCGVDNSFDPNLSSEVRVVTGGGSGNVSSSEISIIKVLDKAEYDALEVKDPTTLYLIRG